MDHSVLKKGFAICFFSSVLQRVTHRISLERKGMVLSEIFSKETVSNSVVVIYHTLMSLAGKIVPFYFDHKVADSLSWPRYDWMFAGLHKPFDYMIDNGRTNFIKGCENGQGNFLISLETQKMKCPARPKWELMSFSKDNDEDEDEDGDKTEDFHEEDSDEDEEDSDEEEEDSDEEEEDDE